MRTKVLTLGFLISLLMSGCIVYHPQAVDIPLISKKNDLRVDAGISILPSAQATVSYGLTQKIAIQGFGSYGTDDSYYFQGAAGLYKNKGNNKVLEVYSGLGVGYGDAYRDSNPGDLMGNYQLYFAQLNYGKISSETSNLEMGFGIKTGYLHSDLSDQNYYYKYPQNASFDTYHDESILLEPAGFIRLGSGKLKFSVKLGTTLIYKFTHTDKNLPYFPVNLGLGLNYRL